MIETIDATEREERNWGVAAHLSALIGGFVVPFGNIIGPLVVYLQNKTTRPFATEHAKASLNFQITMGIVVIMALIAMGLVWVAVAATAIAGSSANSDSTPPFPAGYLVAMFGIVGFVVIAGIWSLVCTILGAVAAGQGRHYRYPVSLYFVK